MKRLQATLLGLCAAVSLAAPAAAESADGSEVAAVCASCHRLDAARGPSAITGRPAGDLVRTLQSFRRGDGDNHVMTTVCRTLSDDEIASVAQYLGSIGKQDTRE